MAYIRYMCIDERARDRESVLVALQCERLLKREEYPKTTTQQN